MLTAHPDHYTVEGSHDYNVEFWLFWESPGKINKPSFEFLQIIY